MLGLTRWWPAFIRVKYFLPKMHQGAVKPEGAAEPDPEAGEGGPTSGGQAAAAGGPTAASTAGTAAAAAAVAAASSGNPLPLLQGAATGQLMLPPPTIMPPGGMIMQTPSNSLPFQQSFMATPQPYRSGPYPGPPIQMSQLPSPHPQQQGAPSPIASQQYQPPPSLNPQQQGAAAPPQPGALAAERVCNHVPCAAVFSHVINAFLNIQYYMSTWKYIYRIYRERYEEEHLISIPYLIQPVNRLLNDRKHLRAALWVEQR